MEGSDVRVRSVQDFVAAQVCRVRASYFDEWTCGHAVCILGRPECMVV